MELILNETQVKELLASLAESPAKYSMGMIQKIQQLWGEQNPPETAKTEG